MDKFAVPAAAFAFTLVERVVEIIIDECTLKEESHPGLSYRDLSAGRKKWEKSNKVLESERNEDLQDLNKKIQALHKDFNISKESTKNEIQIIRADLEKKGMKEEELVRELESMLNKKLQELSQKFQTLEGEVKELPEKTRRAIKIMRADLEKQVKKEILRAVESILKQQLGPLSKKFQTLEEDVQNWQETTKREIQLLRADLEKQGKKEEESSRELVSMLDNKFGQLSQKFQTLEEEEKKWQETAKREIQIMRADLEKQGKKEEKIARELESMLNKKLQELSQKFQTLEGEVKELPEKTKHEIKIMRADLEKQGKKEILRAVESMLKEELGPLSKKFQTLEEDVQNWQETTKREVQLLRADLEKQGKKEEESSRELVSMLDKKFGQLSQKFQTLEEDVQNWQETTKREVQIMRADLEKQGMKEEEIARELVSMLDNKFGQLSQKFQTLEKDVQEWQETTKHEVQLLRAYLEKQGKKEEERSMALQCSIKTLLQQVSQGFQILDQTLQWRQEVPYLEFPLFQAYLENYLGIAMPREEIIHRRVLELAGGERINNTWTDSRCAVGIGPAQGDVWNRRLREARGAEGIDGPPRHALGFSWRSSTHLSLPLGETDKDLLACGGHVSYREDFGTTVGETTASTSHHLPRNQYQGAERLDPSLSSEEGPRRPLESDTRRQ
ncbi:uncharacterized protein LOC106630081 isoform X3 [Zonotrichia albicollis]|uniref:uncharacterized protein LOC106630081 isoform X3 n=1 Tax=Zonotrichia albicollis TaxID=44394 RepID=UPI003D810A57